MQRSSVAVRAGKRAANTRHGAHMKKASSRVSTARWCRSRSWQGGSSLRSQCQMLRTRRMRSRIRQRRIRPTLKEVQAAGRAVQNAVNAAFEGGRMPTTCDVAEISTQLGKVAKAILAGRHAMAVNALCSHALAPFHTEVAGYYCDACQRVMPASTDMVGCRQCNFDLCVPCARSRARKKARRFFRTN